MAIRKFSNLEEINQYLTKETRKALEQTLKTLAPRLKAFIRKTVYHAYSPTFYKRTRWLMRSGVIEHYISNLQGKISGGVHITQKMYGSVSDLERFQHGHPRNRHEPARRLDPEDFVAILNGDLPCGNNPYNFPIMKREPFWEQYLEWVKKEYADIFARKCRNLGIDLNNLGATESPSEVLKGKEPSPTPQETPTSVTGTQMDRSEQGWHGIHQHKSKRGIELHMKIFGTGLGSSALGESILNSTEVIEH